MWVLGGKGDQFELKEEQQFAKQHGVTSLEDGSILIFNNDTYKKDSTIIKIKLDEENSTITLSTMNYACQDLGTSNSNDNIVNGKIKGTVPQYIFRGKE